jgi:hypothetical protein
MVSEALYGSRCHPHTMSNTPASCRSQDDLSMAGASLSAATTELMRVLIVDLHDAIHDGFTSIALCFVAFSRRHIDSCRCDRVARSYPTWYQSYKLRYTVPIV